jgi:CheY-like chemotaxis protein
MRRSRRAATSHDVLVVDDNDDVREAFCALLLLHGYRASGASSGMVALAQMRAGLRPCVVLLDLRMPEMDGWSVWARMHAEPNLATIPVVMVSGDPDQSRRAELLGLRNFIRKPVDAGTLVATVARYCEAAPSAHGA